MASRASAYLRNNIFGLLALVVALSAGAYAAGLSRNSVGSRQIRPGAVKAGDLANDSVSGEKVVDNSLTGRDVDEGSLELPAVQGQSGAKGATGPQGTTGPAGATGPQGPATGPAGGDLSGSYPNPTVRPSEGLHYVGAPGEPSFEHGWTNFGGYYAKAAFYKDRFGVVHLRGLVTGGAFSNVSAGDIFILPDGYQPCGVSPDDARYSDLVFAAVSSNDIGRITITDFDLQAAVRAEAGSGWISLDGIDWRADGC